MAGRTNIFNTIRSEGAILPAELLQRIASGDKNLPGLRPEDYHLAPGERLNEAATRSWNRLRGVWESFKNILEQLSEESIGTTETRERWLAVLFQELGYGRLQAGRALDIDGRTYPISHNANEPIAVHLVSFRQDLDRRTPGRAGASRVSPHSLVQEFLNRHEEYLWGILSNGLKLRILRDNVSLTRAAYVEFDLQAMMDGDAYSDFFLLFLLCHQSRVEVELDESGKPRPPETCWLEKWYNTAVAEGVRALDALRTGVEKAIETLGGGFLAHPANGVLREQLRSGELTTLDYYRQVLRQVYRLLFLFVAEDRDLLAPSDTQQQIKEIYKHYYSSSRLRELAGRKRGTRHGDLWQQLNLIFAKLYRGCPELGLPALGSYLFKTEATAALNDSALTNVDLLAALRNLSYTSKNNVLQPVNYRNLGPEELGSVYESLLEMHPDIHLEAAQFELNVSAGSERKTTGSYYTPTSLVNCLLDSALEPVIAQTVKGKTFEEQERAILNLRICDPACGSGHFLIAAAHRLAKRLAAIRAREEEPAPTAIQHALRDVISRCIYGVDINPMSVELCKVSLWMEAMEPGKPLAFLDHHIKCGNSLLGCTPALLKRGIPDEAFKPIEGDDKEFCSIWKKKNKAALKGQHDLFIRGEAEWNYHKAFEQAVKQLDAFTDDSLSEIERKDSAYQEYLSSSSFRFGKRLYDAWCAAFVWKKESSDELPYPITQQIISEMRRDPHRCPRWMAEEIDGLATEHQFFHWHVAFPEVFLPKANDEIKKNEINGWIGGFDCLLGNPPWERISLKEREFFQGKDDRIASETNSGNRETLIADLINSNSLLFEQFRYAREKALRTKHLLSNSKRFKLSAVGDMNTYALFTDLNDQLTSDEGNCGIIIQTQLVTEKTYSGLTKHLLKRHRIASCFAFENERFLFPGAHHSTRFILLTIAPESTTIKCATALWDVSWLSESERLYSLKVEDVRRLNPDTWSIPQFRATRDAEIATKVYAGIPLLGATTPFREGISASRVMHDKDDAKVICWDRIESEKLKRLPIIESKMIEHYNHRYATYDGVSGDDIRRGYPRQTDILEQQNPQFEVVPRKWVAISNTPDRFKNYGKGWILHVRKIANNIMFRTITAAITPSHPNNGSAAWIRNDSFSTCDYLFLLAILNSFVFDYFARQKIAGVNVNSYHLKQLPLPVLPSEKSNPYHLPIIFRALELTYTSYDLSAIMNDLANEVNDPYLEVIPPFCWTPDRRELIRCELDALIANMFGLAREDIDWILDAKPPSESFRVLRDAEISQHGEFKTRRLILEFFDLINTSISLGQNYCSAITPPPGPPVDADGNFLSMYQWDRHKPPEHIHPSHPDWEESLLSSWYSVSQKRWINLYDEQVFPWDGREAYVYAMIPYLVHELPGENFEFYRDAALLSVQVSRCETLLLDDKARNEYRQIMDNNDWLGFPSTHRVHPIKIREKLQKKNIIETDSSSGATTVPIETKLPPLPRELRSLLPLALKAGINLSKLQQQALEKSEARKISFTADEISKELEMVMVA